MVGQTVVWGFSGGFLGWLMLVFFLSGDGDWLPYLFV